MLPAYNYSGRRAVITGGLGFIGSNLAIRLVELGAQVTVVDSSVRGCGANLYNISSIASDVELVQEDIGHASRFHSRIRKADVIFNLAGEVSHVHSMKFPQRDLRINVIAQLQFLQECARAAPGVRVVYAGTRQVYGIPRYLPVDEQHPVLPIDFNGINKHAAAGYHLLLTRSGVIDALILRLTNVYGPRMALNVPCQGFLAAFCRKILQREKIEIFGDGLQLRDPVYVDDVVEAFLIAGHIQGPPSRVYNIGGSAKLSLQEIGSLVCEAGGGTAPEQREYPEELRRINIGSYYSDCRLAERELNWKPCIPFREGVVSTLSYYADHLPYYLDRSIPCSCKLTCLEDNLGQAALSKAG